MSAYLSPDLEPQPQKNPLPSKRCKYPVVYQASSMATFAMERSIDIPGTNLGMFQLQTRLGSPGFFQKTDPGSLNGTHFGGIEQAANV